MPKKDAKKKEYVHSRTHARIRTLIYEMNIVYIRINTHSLSHIRIRKGIR